MTELEQIMMLDNHRGLRSLYLFLSQSWSAGELNANSMRLALALHFRLDLVT